jgi:hypothetical protein
MPVSGKAEHPDNIELGQFGGYHMDVWPYWRVESFARRVCYRIELDPCRAARRSAAGRR